ncbi:MAG TPA: PilX N-terminal domain-containing pilus assembly protein [Methylomirabilota bacterium]|nr:PilX N-terminal domain-containing pilus assembly protein [Methylomirabilota bacterium]
MQIQILQKARNTRNKSEGQRGVALIITLLLLILLVALTLAMVISTSSDMLINHYYRNFRSSFYAADSGLNIARETMSNQLLAAMPSLSAIPVGSTPIAAGTEATVLASVLTTYGNSPVPLNSGQAANSWPANFQLLNTATYPTCLGASANCSNAPAATCQITSWTTSDGNQPANNPNQTYTCLPNATNSNNPPSGANLAEVTYQYNYPYALSAVGHSASNEQSIVQDSGNIQISVDVVYSVTTKTSFAAYGTFIDQYPPCYAPFVPGYLTGPFFTDGSWNLGNSGPYTFTDTLGQSGNDFSYWVGNNCTQSTSSTFNNISVTYQGTPPYQLGQPTVPLPVNDFNQQEAVADGLGNENLTQAQVNALLAADTRNISGTAYSSSDTSGVFLPYTTTTSASCPTAPCMTGGGIYVQGNATVTLSTATTSGHSKQIFTIVNNNTTTTVTLDLTALPAGTTTISSGASTKVINGLPDNYAGSSPTEAALLYVNGNITSLSGPGQGQTAVQNGSAVTIVAADNVTITGDLLYAEEPVTETQNQTGPNTPIDTLIPANNYGQVLGIFTNNQYGQIQMNNQQANGNLEIDASIAMISQGGSGCWINTGNQINTLNLVGGRIANTACNGNTTTRNIYFDRRFLTNGFAPPWFPATTVTTTGTPKASSYTTGIQRYYWVDDTALGNN